MIKTLLFCLLLLVNSSISLAQEQLPTGSRAPGIRAQDHLGNDIDLDSLLSHGPVVITFYRGAWCPHCNNYMRNLQDSLKLIEEYGAAVLAITPESDIYIDKSVDKTGATFSIIWDEGHRIMDDYRVSFRLSNTKNTVYKLAGINVKEASGSGHRMLPVPATYIIGKDGKIAGGFFNNDYTLRMPVKDILLVLRDMRGEKFQ